MKEQSKKIIYFLYFCRFDKLYNYLHLGILFRLVLGSNLEIVHVLFLI